jgi:hypothetical protein
MRGLSVRGEDRSIEERPIGEGELQTPHDIHDIHEARVFAIPQDDKHNDRPARSPTDMRMRRGRTEEQYVIRFAFGIHSWIGRDWRKRGTYQCTSEVNTDRAFVFSEPGRKVRAWVHAHPAGVVVGSW